MRRPPYLPFLNGPPAFEVGLRPIAPDSWLIPDVEAHWLAEKRALLAARPAAVLAETAGSAAAQAEALMLAQAAAPAANFGAVGLSPLARAAHAVSDDFCVMEKRGGAWVLSAAALCAPTYWSLAANIGGPLTHLHGPVPDRLGPGGAQGLAQRIARIFDAVAADSVLERFNWTVQAGGAHFTPDGAPLRALAEAAPESEAASLLHLRVERQTVRRLPETGGVLFTIRVTLDPLVAVFAEPGAKAALTQAWRAAPAHVRAYKKWAAYERLMAAALA
ncbi:MAG: heme-dependent oxidative N-demethylase subunit alpha family protein [Hyphomonadaceae bacterium]